MVEGVAQLHRRLQAIPPRVKTAVRREIERVAGQLVAQMRRINPLPGDIDVQWTWGAPPAGSVTLARTARRADGIRATIYATARTSAYPGGFPAVARWFEFGTGPRWQRTTGRYSGRIVAQPYFFPVYRAERRRVRSAITRAARRAIQES